MSVDPTLYSHSIGTSNRLNLDYVALASKFKKFSSPIIDVHSHIHGKEASKIYRDSARLYGVGLTYSMTQIEEAQSMRDSLGSSLQFITMPSFSETNKLFAHGKGYLDRIADFRKLGARVVKFWNAPRIYDASNEPFIRSPFRLNSPERIEVMNYVQDQGMMFMTHIGDPDTWFSARYTDKNKYGTKLQQYEDFEDVLTKFKIPWIAAHMGGYSENLPFLSSLLERYPHLYLDCSATKWVVRELSKYDPAEVRAFFIRWQGRILFGSDIVSYDAHLTQGSNKSEMLAKASNRDDAFALYASRYWALRTLFETNYVGESPISDPDLHMVDPENHSPDDAPTLQGCSLPDESLEWLYFRTAQQLLKPDSSWSSS
jgi:hypothetical protein